MNRRFVDAFLLATFALAAFFASRENIIYYKSINVDIFQLIILELMFIAAFYAEYQIDEMRKIKDDEKLVAINSLVEEMKYNERLVKEYIHHCEEGGFIKQEDKLTWEWNKPRFGAYERYLIIAYRSNLDMVKEITSLYEKLDSCRAIIDTVIQLISNNLIEIRCISSSEDILKKVVSKLYTQLKDISIEIKNQIGKLIEESESIIQNKKSCWQLWSLTKMKKVGLVFNIIGVIILGFEPTTLWVRNGVRPTHNFLHLIGWGFLGLGFLLQFIAKEK